MGLSAVHALLHTCLHTVVIPWGKLGGLPPLWPGMAGVMSHHEEVWKLHVKLPEAGTGLPWP